MVFPLAGTLVVGFLGYTGLGLGLRSLHTADIEDVSLCVTEDNTHEAKQRLRIQSGNAALCQPPYYNTIRATQCSHPAQRVRVRVLSWTWQGLGGDATNHGTVSDLAGR